MEARLAHWAGQANCSSEVNICRFFKWKDFLLLTLQSGVDRVFAPQPSLHALILLSRTQNRDIDSVIRFYQLQQFGERA